MSKNQRSLLIVSLCFAATLGVFLISDSAPLRADQSSQQHAVSAAEVLRWQDAIFLDQTGKSVLMSDIIDKPTILSFVFTECVAFCPAQSMSLSFVQEELNETLPKDQYQIVSVSLTPDFDTPSDMLGFAGRFAPDFSNWHFLTGNVDGVDDLIKYTGASVIDYSTETYGDVNHTTDVYFLNAAGDIVGRADGLPLDKETVKRFVKEGS